MREFLPTIAWVWIAIALVTGGVLLRTAAPYGRHRRSGWGPTVPHRAGWIVMELVSPVSLVAAATVVGGRLSPEASILAACWLGHYAWRAVVYPFRARWGGRRMPVVVAAAAVLFNAVNGTLNGLALSWIAPTPGTLVAGLAVWAAGLAVNLHSDGILRRLRAPGEHGYAVPHGGLFRWVSAPNYLGEIVEWAGFALAAWNPAALSFAVWTAANLVPRALANHRWYRERFPEYPPERKALVPGLL